MKAVHLVHHADPSIERNPARKTTISHEKSKRGTPVSVYQIFTAALELSKKSDGTVDLDHFSLNCDHAFDVLTRLQIKLDALQQLNQSDPEPHSNDTL